MSFWNELARNGDRIALIDECGEPIGYTALAEAADAVGMKPGGLVLLEMETTAAAVAAYLGALRAAAPVILIGAGDEAAAKRIEATFCPAMRWSSRDGLQDLGREWPTVHPDLAVLLSTSGTTGTTKLVRLSAAAVEANARSIAEFLELNAQERAITTLPLNYSYGLSVLNSHLAVGGSIVLNDVSVIDLRFRALVEQHEATSLAGVPYTYELLERAGFLDELPQSIRSMTQAGGKLAADRVHAIGTTATRHGARFFVMYGQTEATARMAYLPPARLKEHPDCIGIPIPQGRFELVDPDTGQPALDKGELVYSGPNIMMGYAQNLSDLARGPELERLHTGDLAERVDDLFRIVGRKSRFLKLFGLRLSLEEIEREGTTLGSRIVATGTDDLLVVAAEDGTAETACAHFAQRYGLPANRIVAQEGPIPRLASGKADYQTMIARALVQVSVQQPGAMEDGLRAFYQSLSPHAPIDLEASFASLGGDSMSYVQATMVIEASLGHLPENWEQLTLAQLEAQALDEPRDRMAAVEGEMLARSFAITAIAISHAYWPGPFGIPIAGGSSVLLAIFGYNLFRFRARTLMSDHPFDVARSIFLRYILPYYAIIAFFALKDGFDWHNWALIGVFFNGPSGSLHMYWFFEAIIHLTIIIVALFAIPRLRQCISMQPVRALFGLFVLAIALRLGVEWIRPALAIPPRSPDAFLYLALGGMVIAATSSLPVRIVVCLGMIATLGAVMGASSWIAMLAIGLGLLVLLPRLRMPRPMASLVRVIARSTIYIYLASRIVVAIFEGPLGGHFPLLQVVATLAAGIVLGDLKGFIQRRGWLGRFRLGSIT